MRMASVVVLASSNVDPDDRAMDGAGNARARAEPAEGDRERRERDDRLATTYESADIGISQADSDGRLLRVNEALCDITGRTRDELLRRTVFELTHADDVELDRKLYRDQWAGILDRYRLEKRYIHADGRPVWVAVNSTLVRDEAGQPLYAVRVVQDITRQRIAEQTVKERERQFRELLEMLPAAIYTTDALGRITFFNKAAEQLAGRTPRLGSDEWCITWKLYWPDGTPLPHDQCPMAIALREGRPVRGAEAVAERPDGTRVPFIPFPTPLRDADGNITGGVNVLVDISERKEAEANQKTMLDELNHRVKNNMQMLSSLLRSAERDCASQEARAVLAGAGRRVTAMAAAQQVLYESGSPGDFDARQFLAAVCAAASQGFGPRMRLDLRSVAKVRLRNDMAMPLALILNELLTNAAKHGAGGRPGAVRVDLERRGDTFELCVEDDGPGFTLPVAGRRSSGLGLVGGLVRQLGGRFDVRQAPTRCIVTFDSPRCSMKAAGD